MTRKDRPSTLRQTAFNGVGTALSIGIFFLSVCLCSAATARSMAVVSIMLTLSSAFLFYGRLRDRIAPPAIALALVVLMDAISCAYALSGKFALYEFLKVVVSFCIALILLAFIGKDRPERKVSILLEGCAAIAGLVSIDLLSTRWVSTPVLTVLGWFTPDYTDLEVVEEGVRMISMFMYANPFAACMGIGVLLGLGLTVTCEDRRARVPHLICLSFSSLAFVLAFSMGACAMIVPAFLALLVLTNKEHRTGLLILMAETLVVTLACAFPISLTSMTAWDGVRPIPLLCAVGGAAALCALDILLGQRAADKLKGHERAVLCLLAALLAAAVAFAIAAGTLTTTAILQPGETLRRSIYPEPGAYTLTAEADGDPNVVIESQNQENTIMHTYSELYRGPLSQAAFTVPEDSLVVWFRFSANEAATLDSVEYSGENGSGTVPLKYRLLPSFIANRLQGLKVNQNAIQRFAFFRDGLELFRRSPVVGLGLGAFASAANSVQSFYYYTKYTHNHYIQVLAETGLVGLILFLGLLAVSAACVWRGRKKPLAPALGATLLFLALHGAVEGIFSYYASMPMIFAVFAAIGLCCGEDLPLPGWARSKTAKNGAILGICALLILFGALLGCNIAAYNIVTDASDLEQLEQAAALDPFEKADYMLTYVVQVTGTEPDPEIREKADGYARRLGKLESNSIPYYLAEYYLDSGRVTQGLEQAERYVSYVASDLIAWQNTFALLEQYEQDTEEYRAGVRHIAELLDQWNEENMGSVELDEQSRAFVERMGG